MSLRNLISSGNAYVRLFEESPCPMYIYDSANFNFLDVNAAALAQYGYSQDEFLSLTAKDIHPAEDLNLFIESNSSITGSYFDAGTWRHLKKDGTVFYVHIFSRNIEFEEGKAKLVLAINIDKEIKIEKALGEKITEIENVLESITDGFYALNSNWQFTYINKEFERILQCKRDEVIGKSIWDVFPAARYLKFFGEYQKAMHEKTAVHFEEYYAPLKVWASVNAYPANDGIAVFFLDITEQKKIQEQLYSEEQNLRAIINNTKDIIWSIDKDFNIVTANRAFWQRIESITGKPVNKVMPEDYSREMFNTWQDYYTRAFTGETFKITWIENTGGKTSYDDISFNPVYDRNNQVAGISCFSRDITGQQNYQDRIEKQNEQLRQIAWLQSHKIRNHLANILGLVNLFNYDDKTDPFNADIITLTRQAANNMDEVIKEISTHTEVPED